MFSLSLSVFNFACGNEHSRSKARNEVALWRNKAQQPFQFHINAPGSTRRSRVFTSILGDGQQYHADEENIGRAQPEINDPRGNSFSISDYTIMTAFVKPTVNACQESGEHVIVLPTLIVRFTLSQQTDRFHIGEINRRQRYCRAIAAIEKRT